MSSAASRSGTSSGIQWLTPSNTLSRYDPVAYAAERSIDGVRLIATGTTIHVGRTTATAEGRVHDESGRLVAHGTTTCIILRGTS